MTWAPCPHGVRTRGKKPSTWVVRVTLYFLGGNEWVRSHVTRCVDPLLPLLLSARGVVRGAPLAAPGVSLATGRGGAKGSLPVC